MIGLNSIMCGNLFAQQADSVKAVGAPDFSSQMAPTLAKLGIALLVIVVLIYLSIFMLKKLSYAKSGKSGLSGIIDIVDRHHLSPKKQLCLVRVDKKYLLVGITEQAVNLVADVSDQNLETKQTVSKPEYQGFSFKKFFNEAKMNLPMFSRQVENPQKSQ